MKIDVSRRFRKLRLEVDNFANELKDRAGKLSLVCIGRTVKEDGSKGKMYHEDGVYDFAFMKPSDNGYCFAEVLKEDGTKEKVKLSYLESGILVPDDELVFNISHPGSFRRVHSSVSTRKALGGMTGEYVLVNDSKPSDNSIYSTRKIIFCNSDGYRAEVIKSEGEIIPINFTYNEAAGLLVPERKVSSGLKVPITY